MSPRAHPNEAVMAAMDGNPWPLIAALRAEVAELEGNLERVREARARSFEEVMEDGGAARTDAALAQVLWDSWRSLMVELLAEVGE